MMSAAEHMAEIKRLSAKEQEHEREAIERRQLVEMAVRYGKLIENAKKEEQMSDTNTALLPVTDIIRVTQLPKIEERLREVKDEWEQMAAANMSLVCNADNIQSVKTARAELTKRYKELEELRKAIKDQYMAEYNCFDATYKDCITEPYKRADADLARKISEVEGEIKAECEKRCIQRFRELCAVHGVDFLSWQQLNIKIDLTSAKQKTPNKLFDAISEKISAVANGMDRIDRECAPEDRDEIMTEYKQCLDVGAAILRVQDRKRRVEAERQAAEERAARKAAEAAAVAKVEAAVAAVPVAPPVEVTAEPEPELTVTFTATATRAKLLALREWMTKEGIKYV